MSEGKSKPQSRNRGRLPDRPKHYLRQWREFRGWSQRDAAERLGWPQSKISRAEQDEISITLDILYAAAVMYSCSVWDLLFADPTADADQATARQVSDFARFLEWRKSRE